MGNSSSNGSGFSSSSTADQVATDAVTKRGSDLTNMTIIVTGANSGIGKETARVLAKHKARVIVAGRSVQQCADVAKEIAEETKNDLVQSMQLDLASFKSIKKFAEEFNALDTPLDVLINNAGVMAVPKFSETEEGFEMQFGINHMGHFYLTQLLTDKLKKAKSARVVNVSSKLHQKCAALDWEANMPPVKEKYDSWASYAISKATNILFARELNQRFQEKEDTKHITAYSLHPGVIHTNLARDIPGSSLMALGAMFMKSIPQGAATTVFCAIHPDAAAHAGGYFDNSQVAEPKGAATVPENATKLWELSEKLVREKSGQEVKSDN